VSLRQTLLDAPADQVMFLSESQDAITAAMIRSAAARLLPDIECGAGELYIFTRSAALFCAAYLAASAADRPLVLLPQGSADFRAEQNVPANSFVSDHENGGHWLTFDGADRQLTIEGADAELVFFTSGSSGAAKSIRRMPVAIETEARHWAEWLDGQIDHVAGTVSHQHIYGLIFRVFLPVLGKITSSDLAALSWEALSVQIHDRTLVATSPAHLTRLPDAQNGPGLDHAMTVSSGGPLPWTAAQAATELFGFAPLEVLGSTETSGVARRFRNSENEPWTVLGGVSATVSDDGVLQVSSPFTGDANPVSMGDRATFLPDGRFELGGRVDRILKVEGKRVSLNRVESALRQNDFVEEVALLPTQQGARERLSALVVLNDAGRLELGRLGAFAFSRKLIVASGDRLAPTERPKRWRFVPDIPVNSQGKRVQRDLAALFEVPRMQEILSPQRLEVTDDKAHLVFKVEPDLPWFRGHFTNAPVLPGLSQVHMAVRLAEEIWSVAPASFNVSRMKFQKVIQPGDVVEMDLSFNFQTRRLTFSMTGPDIKYSGGVIG